MFNYVGKRNVSEDQHDSLTSSKRIKMSTGTDVITDASTTHQTLSSHDSGMCTSVMYACNKLQLLSWSRFYFNNKANTYNVCFKNCHFKLIPNIVMI